MLALVTRPRAQAEGTAAALRGMGHEPLVDPMLRIEPRKLQGLSLDGVAAVVLTSANAVPALTPGLRAMPVYAVGTATAAAAREAGCARVRAGSEDGRALARLMARELDSRHGAVLHLGAAEPREGIEGGLGAAGFAYRHIVAYDTLPAAALAPATIEAVAAGRLGAALFFSPRTAAVWSRLAREAGIEGGLRAVPALCLSPAVAAALRGLAWSEVRVARARDQAALLACLDGGGRR